MQIDQYGQTPQAKRKRIDSIEEAKELDLKEIDVEVSKQVDEIDKQAKFLGKNTNHINSLPILGFYSSSEIQIHNSHSASIGTNRPTSCLQGDHKEQYT